MESIGTKLASREETQLLTCEVQEFYLYCIGTSSTKFTNSKSATYFRYETKLYNTCIEFDIPLALTHIKVTSLVVASIRKNLLAGESWADFQAWYNAFVMETFDYIIKNAKDL